MSDLLPTAAASIGLADGSQALVYESLTSTSDLARTWAASGTRLPLWVIAREQTAGRGRRGRAWAGLDGNFFGTLAFDPYCPPQTAAQLSFVTALAVHEALSALTGAGDRLKCKWPNDILLDGAKLAGILLETVETKDGLVRSLLVGVGINLRASPKGIDQRTISLPEAGLATESPDRFVERLHRAFMGWAGRWQAQGFAPVRDGWLAVASGLGEKATISIGGEQFVAQLDDLDLSGALWVRTLAGKRRRIDAGDVILPDSQG